ncbi:hypothetical protein CAPTEDRAFT_194397 [Capitella teleta]|uniref:Uncharacterized protein n=1 Tax=Capitella teleta TaxID=283909 RepID=R7V4H0_CAPTE|nr:hypothetical protein CAPTEDRAFT_194397 [Capitella teleta]|eukprot:ELU13367.1 hypothetical protein CAPTEDRAFT_194397 [Capitella teleta]
MAQNVLQAITPEEVWNDGEQSVLNCLQDVDMQRFSHLIADILHKLGDIQEPLRSETVKTAHAHQFSNSIATYIQADAYRCSPRRAFAVSKLSHVHFKVGLLVFRHCEKNLLKRILTLPTETSHEDPRIAQLYQHSTAASKVRYVGGSVIARLIFRTRKAINAALNNNRLVGLTTLWAQLGILEGMTVPANTPSSYPGNLTITDDKSYGRLTYLTDGSYLFFVALEANRLQRTSPQRLALIGGHLPGLDITEILNDVHLRDMYVGLIPHPEVDGHELLESLIDQIQDITSTRHKIIQLYMRTGKQFRNSLLAAIHVEKKEAHRRCVRKKRGKEPCALSASQVQRVIQDTVAYDNGHCAECDREYIDGDEWVQCDGCERWFERRCTNLHTDPNYWQDVAEGQMSLLVFPWCQQDPVSWDDVKLRLVSLEDVKLIAVLG